MSNMNICPVCMGYKKLKYHTNYYYGSREVETTCWACRGSGTVDYESGELITETQIEYMYESLGV